MQITEVRIKLMDKTDDRLRAFCSITFDDWFVVRDLKIIEGINGPFVAMPSRKLTAHCPHCGMKNHLRAVYCNQCGKRQEENRTGRDQEGRVKLYADIAHPINCDCREMIQERVIAEYEEELERAAEPGYVSRYDETYGDDLEDYEFGEDMDRDRSKLRPVMSTHIQSAEPTPPPPHPGPRAVAAPRTPENSGGFGAGIFDD